ncbi:MAG TPA: hypothetical protein PK674_01115 [Candidatus Absconditabacterales bacterium]|nr:hypothetical protein [Candidatus Absconditabacterales bacterium]HOQ78804.1 hypothetical protein [Candidatus Absconditabacterales bacterium]HPK27924.1 hypothetical protein [Candidatus Absconditabacterales bacterium]
MTGVESSGEKGFFDKISNGVKTVWEKAKELFGQIADWFKEMFGIESKTQKSLTELAKEIVENQTKDDLKKLIKDMEETTGLTEIEMKFIGRNKELSDYYKWLKDNLSEKVAKKEMDIFLSNFIEKTKSDDKLTTDEEKQLKSKILTSDEKKELLGDKNLQKIIQEIVDSGEDYSVKEIIAVYDKNETKTKDEVLSKLSGEKDLD